MANPPATIYIYILHLAVMVAIMVGIIMYNIKHRNNDITLKIIDNIIGNSQ